MISDQAPRRRPDILALPANEVLNRLDLNRPELAAVRQAVQTGDHLAAQQALLLYFRERWPRKSNPTDLDADTLARAQNTLEHKFHTESRGEVQFPSPMDWSRFPGTTSAPTEIIRFRWAPPLGQAWAATGDERFARKFIELTQHFFEHHPISDADFDYAVTSHPRRWSWMDLNAVRRSQAIVRTLPLVIHAACFTPSTLMLILARLVDHAELFVRYPKREVAHNMAMSEQDALSEIGETIPEFAQAQSWIALAVQRMEESLLAQTTIDGVQNEWAPSYHLNVLGGASRVLDRMIRSGQTIPPVVLDRYRAMMDHVNAIATPGALDTPAFGDAKRAAPDGSPVAPSSGSCAALLRTGSRLLNDPKYAALADRRFDDLPRRTLFPFPHAGLFVFRSDWTDEQTYLAVHNVAGPTTWHDEPDNATFELCAFGRWLMNDTGYFTYGENQPLRAQHRRTDMHQTLTLDRRDAAVAGRTLLHHADPVADTIVIDNASYEGLTHRRTIWFVDHRWFVLLDEAIGSAPGQVSLHFQFAPGDIALDATAGRVHTQFHDANVLLALTASTTVKLAQEQGWYAHHYRDRTPRQAIVAPAGNAPAWYLTVLAPYRGMTPPDLTLHMDQPFQPGDPCAHVQLHTPEGAWRLGRDLQSNQSWCGLNRK